MLVVTFENRPDGDPRHGRKIGEIQIVTQGAPTDDTRSFDVAIHHTSGEPGNFREGHIPRFIPENATVYHLLALALQSCGIYPEDAI